MKTNLVCCGKKLIDPSVYPYYIYECSKCKSKTAVVHNKHWPYPEKAKAIKKGWKR